MYSEAASKTGGIGQPGGLCLLPQRTGGGGGDLLGEDDVEQTGKAALAAAQTQRAAEVEDGAEFGMGGGERIGGAFEVLGCVEAKHSFGTFTGSGKTCGAASGK